MRRSELPTPHGRCAVVELVDADLADALAALPALERARAGELTPSRRRDFVAGRAALHVIVGAATPVGASDRGAPVVVGWTCSIAHKGAHKGSRDGATKAAAIAAPFAGAHVGIDLEVAAAPRVDISSKILTPREPRAAGAELARVFAVKEAVYKAVDPVVRRYVKFTEVEVAGDDVLVVDPATLPVAVTAWSTELDGYWLAVAIARVL